MGPKREAILIVAILAGAGATRLIGLGNLPQGILPDEASNGFSLFTLMI